MKIFENKKLTTIISAVLLVAILICAIIFIKQRNTPEYWTGYAMSTTISQTAYGKNAFDTMRLVQKGLEDFEAEMSMYKADSDIYKLNANAGLGEIALSDNAFNMLKTAQTLEKQSDGAFKITIAPVTTLWGVNTPTPKVPSAEDLHLAMALVNENDLVLNDTTKTATLAKKGEAVDLGGIAKGESCNVAKRIYNENGVKSAVLSIGGNIYVHGKKPNGEKFKVGFRDPTNTEDSYIASVRLQDTVFAVSGGYERNFVGADGKTYHHIIDPATGYPAVSDIVSVGVISENGAKADCMSTTLFIWGKEKTLEYMEKRDCEVIMLDNQNNLYVSKELKEVFELHTKNEINVVFI